MKKLVSIIIAMLMLTSIMAGCAVNTAQESTTASQNVSESSSSSEKSVSTVVYEAAAPSEESVPVQEDSPEKVAYDLPLFEETLKFTMFYPMPSGPDSGSGVDTADYPFWVSVAEKLNVVPEFERYSESVTTEKYNLMIAADELTDVVVQGNAASYSTGLDMAVEDEVYVDLTDLVEKYAPNYSYYLQTDDAIAKEIMTNDGRIVVMSTIYSEPTGVNQGMLVHTEKLEATGHELTDVAEEWIEIFEIMQANGTPHPAATTPSGNCCNNAFYYAFGTTGSSGFMVRLEDNTIYYDPISEGFRAYVEFFRNLYEKEIIDPDFYNTFGQEYFMDGTYATWMGNYQDLTAFPANYGVNVTAVPPLHLKDSETGEPKVTDYSSSVQTTSGTNGICISANCENIEEVMKFFDWFYSDEGTLCQNYGFDEGVSYEILADGNYQLLPEMLDRDPVTNLTGRGQYTLFEGWGYLISGVQLAVESEAAVAANELWSSADSDAAECMGIPSLVTLTAEESTEAATVLADIETYVESTLMQWYTCTAELNDDTWNEYVKTINDLGIETVVVIYKTAYDRYLAK